ncbi:MAG: hypothetical protein ACI3XI_03790 [Eubacteriales bacterium]
MKKHIIRRISLFLALVTVLGACLCSCGVKPIPATEEESAVVGTIGRFEILYDEYRYLVLNHKKDMMAKYGEDIWADPEKAEKYEAELWGLVRDSIVSDYYAVLAMADDFYLGNADVMMKEDAILDAVQENVESVVDECGSFRKYKAALAEQFMTDRLFRFYIAAEECATELFYILVRDLGVIESDDDYITDYMHSESFIRTNHIFLKGVTEENRALANSLRDQLADADNRELEMIMLKGIYCADYTMTTTHGKYFARYTSDYGEEYEREAFTLSVGSLSDVVETSEGFYVILRLEVEDDYLDDNFDDFKDDILGSEFNKILAEYKEALTFELNDFGKSINISEIE